MDDETGSMMKWSKAALFCDTEGFAMLEVERFWLMYENERTSSDARQLLEEEELAGGR